MKLTFGQAAKMQPLRSSILKEITQPIKLLKYVLRSLLLPTSNPFNRRR